MKFIHLPFALVLAGCGMNGESNPSATSTMVTLGAPPVSVSAPAPGPTPVLPPATMPAGTITTRIIVPAYFTPGTGSFWPEMVSVQKSGVDVTAIFSPYFGPGTASNPDYAAYVEAIAALHAAGGKAIGYVDTALAGKLLPAKGFSCQPKPPRKRYSAQDIVDCARQYKTLYAIDGIFLDQFGTSGPAVDGVKFYQAVYNGIKKIDPGLLVVGNPGTEYIPEDYLRRGRIGGADVLVEFESQAANYEGAYAGTPFATYARNYDAGRFANILHSSGSRFNLTHAVALSKRRNVGYLFITDDVLPNPYDTLPQYWSRFADVVRASNPK